MITTGITDQGTVIGILFQQAVPVFADLEPDTANLSVEAVARAIHAFGPRAEGPFLTVDCSVGSPDEVEHALFGVTSEGRANGAPSARATPSSCHFS